MHLPCQGAWCCSSFHCWQAVQHSSRSTCSMRRSFLNAISAVNNVVEQRAGDSMNQVVLIGHFSGAHTAAMLASDPQWLEGDGIIQARSALSHTSLFRGLDGGGGVCRCALVGRCRACFLHLRYRSTTGFFESKPYAHNRIYRQPLTDGQCHYYRRSFR